MCLAAVRNGLSGLFWCMWRFARSLLDFVACLLCGWLKGVAEKHILLTTTSKYGRRGEKFGWLDWPVWLVWFMLTDWPIWLVRLGYNWLRYYYYFKWNYAGSYCIIREKKNGKEKERKPVLLSCACAIVSCTSSPLWLAKIGLDSDWRNRTWHRLMHFLALNDCYSTFIYWHNLHDTVG